jgi:hypothetical protein
MAHALFQYIRKLKLWIGPKTKSETIKALKNSENHGHFNARDVLEKFPHIGASA